MHADGPHPFLMPSRPSNRRRHGRIRAKEIRTRLGEVADLSASGMRIICCRPDPPANGSILQLELKHPDGSLPVKVKVVWVHMRSESEYELGLVFEDVNPSIEAGLVAMARLAFQSMSVELHDTQSDPDD